MAGDINQARKALAAAINAAGISAAGGRSAGDPATAKRLFTMATDNDPTMADAWLGRVALGDGRLSTLETVARNGSRLGDDLARLNLKPAHLAARVRVDDYISYTVYNADTAQLAYIAALVNDSRYDEAHQLLQAGPAEPTEWRYLRASMATRVQRWPDVLAAVGEAKSWSPQSDSVLRHAAVLLAAQSAAWLGLMESALDDAAEAAKAADPLVVATARFVEAMVNRFKGEEPQATTILTDIVARWPEFAPARTALTNKDFGLVITDPESIDSRTDRWDPTSGSTAAQREESKANSEAKELVKASEARLEALIGQEPMKTEMRFIRADVKVTLFRSRKGLSAPPPTQHAIFGGPPGTGKTESATSFAEWLCGYRLIRSPEPLVFRRETVLGEHLGESENNITRLIEQAIREGRLLFCDEFQEMFQEGMSGGDAFGNAVLSGLMAAMENERHQLVVVVAGYKRGVEKVLDRNGGMRSRFAAEVPFVGFDPGELLQITDRMASINHVELEGPAKDLALDTYTKLYNYSGFTEYGDEARGTDLAANARYVRNLVQRAKKIHSFRIEDKVGADFDWEDDKAEIDPILLKTVIAEDIYDAIPAVTKSELRTVLGR